MSIPPTDESVGFLDTVIMKPLTDIRPWGKFEQFTLNEKSTVKILTVEAGKRLSLQSHKNRDEFWIALDDGAIAEINGVQKILKQGERMFIPQGTKHRLASNEKTVRVLEIAFGNFDEKDITRHEDDHGRA